MLLFQKDFVNLVIASSDQKLTTVKHVNIAHVFLYHNYLLLAFALGAIALFSIFIASDQAVYTAISIWSMFTLGVIVVALSISYRLSCQKPIKLKVIHWYLVFISTLLGMLLAMGIGIVIHYHGIPTDNLQQTEFGSLAFIIIMLLIALVTLSHFLPYLLLFISTALTSLLFIHTSPVDIESSNTATYGLLFLLVYIIIVLAESRRRNFCSEVFLEGWQSKKIINNLTQSNEEQLLSFIELENTNKILEDQLSNVEHNIDTLVNVRTKEISEKKEQLLTDKYRLELANKTAGIATWNWDIVQKSINGLNIEMLLDYSSEEIPILLKNFFNIVHVEDEPHLRKYIKRFLNGQEHRFDSTFRIKNKHGQWVWLEVTGVIIEHQKHSTKPLYVVGTVRDVTLDKSVTDSLNLSSKVFEQSADAIFVLDANLNYISINPSYEKITGFSINDLEEQPLFLWYKDIVDNNNNIQQILHVLKTTGNFSGQIHEKNKQGEHICLELSINEVLEDQNNDVVNFIGVFSDLTQQTHNSQKLSYLENYDELTDLPNRRFFNQQLHTMLSDNIDKFAVIRMNIDRFNVLNSSLGSENADLLLRYISDRISNINYTTRVLARIGGDDFSILYSHTSLYDLNKYLHCIYEEFSKPFFIDNREIHVDLSMGVSLFPQHGNQVDILINNAEQALKLAKHHGGNQSYIYNRKLNTSSENFIEIETQLRHAISKGELVPFYQPKLCLKTGNIIGFEALVRWQHPQRGLLTPSVFMPIAEETGLVNDIGIEMLIMVCNQIRKWQANPDIRDFTVAVNVDVQQLKRGNFLTQIDDILLKTKIDPKSLEIEITESSLMDMPKKLLAILDGLKERNISIAMDDFGTGYSSLSYLSIYPIDVIKIDQSFVHNLSGSSENISIVKAIIAMGQSLGMQLVAEGIETKEQLEFLTKEGCHIVQGYYCGKPAHAEKATESLTSIKEYRNSDQPDE